MSDEGHGVASTAAVYCGHCTWTIQIMQTVCVLEASPFANNPLSRGWRPGFRIGGVVKQRILSYHMTPVTQAIRSSLFQVQC